MSVQDRAFSLAAKVIRVISLKNVAIWTCAALVAILGYTAFERRTELVVGLPPAADDAVPGRDHDVEDLLLARDALVNYIVNGPQIATPGISSFTVSETSKNRIKQIVDLDELINVIIVLNVDIRNNRRVALHWYSDDTSLQKSIDGLFTGRSGGVPLFTSDDRNNEAIVGIINGEFSCSSFKDGGNSGIFPGLDNRLPYICRASLPPYYGQFSGYITIALNRVPSAEELNTLKAETINIATEVYFRDVLPMSQKVTTSRRPQ